MKIDIAESLLRSWLRHCEKCQFAELNWKPSPEWGLDLTPELTAIFEQGKSRFPEAIKKTSSVGQFLRQAEIDVLGMRIGSAGNIDTLFAIDTAFHSRGLSYGGNEETKSRVLKKLVRTAILLAAYFPGVEARVMFVAPIINPGRLEFALGAIQDATDFFGGESNISFELCGPENFREMILEPVLQIADSVADTSELFLRAQQLLAPFVLEPDRPANAHTRRESSARAYDSSDKREARIAAYYMSRFEHHGLGLGNQSETFNRLADALEINVKTLRNFRDYFDPHTGSDRRGWWQVDLPPGLSGILNELEHLNEAELREMVLQSIS